MYKKIALALLISLFCFVLVETYCRIDGRYASYAERTGAGGYTSPFESISRDWYDVAPSHTAIQYRRKEFAVSWIPNNEYLKGPDLEMSKDKIRIIVLGDSYTEGVGADNDSSFPAQLGYLLKDSLPRPSEVWNCGYQGSDPVYEFRLFHDKLLKYKPDMAIVVINSSDIGDVITRGGFERFLPDSMIRYRKSPWFEPLYAHSFMVRRLVHDVLGYDWQFIPAGEVARAHADAVGTLCTAMDSFARICSERDIKLLFVFHPFLGQFDTTAKYDNEPLISYCRDKRLPYADVREEMSSMGWHSSDIGELYWPIDGHCRNKGYHLFAMSVYRKIIEEWQD